MVVPSVDQESYLRDSMSWLHHQATEKDELSLYLAKSVSETVRRDLVERDAVGEF